MLIKKNKGFRSQEPEFRNQKVGHMADLPIEKLSGVISELCRLTSDL
jgi:hypothetical protein